MKTSLCLLFSWFMLLLASTNFYAQVNQVDGKGKKQGPWNKTYPNSSVLIYEGQFKDDQPIGVFTYYFSSGAKKAIIQHGLPGGKSAVQMFFENGQLLSDGFYVKEKKDSLWLNYAQSGEIVSAESYLNNVLHGKSVYYYKEGQLLENKLQVERRVNFLDGKQHGLYQTYFYNGKLKQEGHFVNGKKQGKWSEYSINGQLFAQMNYKDDFLHGWVSAFDQKGQLKRKAFYLRGEELSEKELKAYMERCKAQNIDPEQ